MPAIVTNAFEFRRTSRFNCNGYPPACLLSACSPACTYKFSQELRHTLRPCQRAHVRLVEFRLLPRSRLLVTQTSHREGRYRHGGDRCSSIGGHTHRRFESVSRLGGSVCMHNTRRGVRRQNGRRIREVGLTSGDCSGFLHPVVHLRPADAQQGGGSRNIAVGALQGRLDQRILDRFERDATIPYGA